MALINCFLLTDGVPNLQIGRHYVLKIKKNASQIEFCNGQRANENWPNQRRGLESERDDRLANCGNRTRATSPVVHSVSLDFKER